MAQIKHNLLFTFIPVALKAEKRFCDKKRNKIYTNADTLSFKY